MKAQLTFNLPDEQIEFNDAINGSNYRAIIWEMDQYLRSQLKHEQLWDEKVHDKVQEIRDELQSILENHSITMDQIWQ